MKFRQYFIELNIRDFDFTNGFRCSDVYIFERLNNLTLNIFELGFYQDDNKWRHNLIPIGISENKSGRVIDVSFIKIIMLSLKN